MIALTEDEVDALAAAIELALEDQKQYLKIGDPVGDYGDEWPEVSEAKSASWTHIASACAKLGLYVMAENCIELSLEFDTSV